ncbi:MAG TPA: hypothetical protein VHU88_05070 [Sporichthyaceae bacterium]|jgi:hypothetical protein|nr:hypothetical protein [Sporichthyaceae bacterium]
MSELTSRQVREISNCRSPHASVLAVAEADGSGLALIDPDGWGARIVVEHYIQDEQASWHLARQRAETAPSDR